MLDFGGLVVGIPDPGGILRPKVLVSTFRPIFSVGGRDEKWEGENKRKSRKTICEIYGLIFLSFLYMWLIYNKTKRKLQ